MISQTGRRRSRCLRPTHSLSRHFPFLQSTKRAPEVRSRLDSSRGSFAREGIIIAVESLYTSTQAAKHFDKNDIVARGIMPIATPVFNSNEPSAEAKATCNELIREGDCARQ